MVTRAGLFWLAILMGCRPSGTGKPGNLSLPSTGHAREERVPNTIVRAHGEWLKRQDVHQCTVVFVKRREELEAEGPLNRQMEDTTIIRTVSTSDKRRINAIIDALCSSARAIGVPEDPYARADRVRADYIIFRTSKHQESRAGFMFEALERDHGRSLLEAIQQVVINVDKQ
jgi:hypothetical protein